MPNIVKVKCSDSKKEDFFFLPDLSVLVPGVDFKVCPFILQNLITVIKLILCSREKRYNDRDLLA